MTAEHKSSGDWIHEHANLLAISSKRFVRNAQSQAHEQLDTWTNAWHDKNTL